MAYLKRKKESDKDDNFFTYKNKLAFFNRKMSHTDGAVMAKLVCDVVSNTRKYYAANKFRSCYEER